MMGTYLFLTLMLCALLPLSNGSCYYMVHKSEATHCLDKADNKWYPFGSSWRNSECMDCTCSGCCTVYSTPTHFPDDCVSVFDKAACKFRVHKMDDPSVECPIFGGVMK